MNINDIVHTTNLSSTQRISIINKGLKIGELEVTAELGCDHIHFGREFVGECTCTINAYMCACIHIYIKIHVVSSI